MDATEEDWVWVCVDVEAGFGEEARDLDIEVLFFFAAFSAVFDPGHSQITSPQNMHGSSFFLGILRLRPDQLALVGHQEVK